MKKLFTTTAALAWFLATATPSFSDDEKKTEEFKNKNPVAAITNKENAESAGSDAPPDSKPKVTFSSGYLSSYRFDQVPVADNVGYVGVDISRDTWYLSIFEMRELERDKWTETHIDAGFVKPLSEKWELAANVEGYTIEGNKRATAEVGIGLTHTNPLCRIGVRGDHDFVLGKGTYLELSVAKNFSIRNASAEVHANLGYNDHYWTDKSRVSGIETGASVSFPVGKNGRSSVTFGVDYLKSLHKPLVKDNLAVRVGIQIPLGRNYGGR